MTTFLNLIAAEPDIARIPIMIDSSKWEVIEAGLQVHAGQGRRQLHQPQGGRGGVPRQARTIAATVLPSWSWPSTRSGQADTPAAQGRHLRPRLRLLVTEAGFDPRTSSSIPTSSRSPPASRAAPATHQLHRGDEWIKANLPGAHVSGGVSNVSFSFRGNDRRARGDAQRLPLPRHRGRHGHGHRQRRAC